ncbi:heat-shock protein [Pseudoalteromonas sp. NBT06-2]|uniref:ribosome-associated heat shock protein Hsp15 n=1 Tax=Pseudoalteromonas sp. NBT06-2 TaxID=2025950 RepID=UPI000BA56277|nr:ribosome-associated heat shock protein Hsp15 [Pseudoalteromonas sp. NBT06-2]PAJ73523.1 heat-shock protein [Pseudoalteromonas sp. NBT06-2]
MAKNPKTQPNDTLKVRLDKWLWAARFYKTRAIARDMVQGGKVQYNGQRCKASKTVEIGAIIKLTQNYDEKIITVLVISEHRRGAPEAQLLYQESDESIKQREINTIARKNNNFFSPHPDRKPDKKQRRKIIQFKQN